MTITNTWGLSAGVGDGDGVDKGALAGLLVGEGLGRWVALFGEHADRRQSAAAALGRGRSSPSVAGASFRFASRARNFSIRASESTIRPRPASSPPGRAGGTRWCRV